MNIFDLINGKTLNTAPVVAAPSLVVVTPTLDDSSATKGDSIAPKGIKCSMVIDELDELDCHELHMLNASDYLIDTLN